MSSSITWSDKRPTTEGWYWVKSDMGKGALSVRIVNVFRYPDEDYLCVFSPMIDFTAADGLMPIADIEAQWAGPIAEPDEGIV